jgi:hypothetical protein
LSSGPAMTSPKSETLSRAFSGANPIIDISPPSQRYPSGQLHWRDGSVQKSTPKNGFTHTTIFNGREGAHYSYDRLPNGTFSGGHWTYHGPNKQIGDPH